MTGDHPSRQGTISRRLLLPAALLGVILLAALPAQAAPVLEETAINSPGFPKP
jgi:hypothetical protein